MTMGYAQARRLDADAIPVIDITPLRDGTDERSVARALHAASSGLGFIYIRGHGIPETAIADARASAFDFFRSPAADKESVRVSPKHRGWLGQGGARMQDGARADLKESFIWGFQDEAGETPEDHPLRGPNRWPGFLPAMERHAMAYFHHAHGVAHHLMRGFALGLDLAPDFFLRTASRPLSRASFVYYPPQPDPDRWSNSVFTSPRWLHFHTCGAYAPGEICWMVGEPKVEVDGKALWREGRLWLDLVNWRDSQMSTASRQIIGWEAAGVVIVAVGALHFAFAWSGKPLRQ
jgi:hypothetical protein